MIRSLTHCQSDLRRFRGPVGLHDGVRRLIRTRHFAPVYQGIETVLAGW